MFLQEVWTIECSLLFCSVKVLILHQHFNTPEKGGALRSYFLAKALVDGGHQPVVITAHNHQELLHTTFEGIEVFHLPIPYDNAFGFYKRVRSFLSFILQSAKIGSSLSGIEKCYAMSTPLTVGLAAILLKWKKGIPFIFEVGDLWPDAPIQLGFVKNPFLKFILYRLEKFIYKQSASIVALSVQMKEIIEKKAPTKVVHLIPNMADTDFFKPSDKQRILEDKFAVQNRFVVSYIGSIGFANGLEFLLDCARIAENATMPISFLLCGEGALLAHLKKTTQKLQINNVVFVPSTNRLGVQEVMNVTDASFTCYRQHAILETGSPNKYFDGLAAGKLILANVGGWIKNDLEQHHCGVAVDTSRPDELIKKLSPFVQNAELLKKAQQNARILAEKYSRKKLGADFVKIVTT